jgi:hypothetical protein
LVADITKSFIQGWRKIKLLKEQMIIAAIIRNSVVNLLGLRSASLGLVHSEMGAADQRLDVVFFKDALTNTGVELGVE